MAAITGTKGKVTVGGTSIQSVLIRKWTLTFTRDLHDISNFDSATNEAEFLGGMMGAVGAIEGFVDGSVADPPILTDLQNEDSIGTANWKLSLVDGTKEYDFTAIVSNFSIQHDKVAGPVPFTATFESTGTIGITNS